MTLTESHEMWETGEVTGDDGDAVQGKFPEWPRIARKIVLD